MTDEGPRPESWQPTEAFLDAARRFAELRLTQKYREDEVDYKESLAAVIRQVFSREALETPGAGQRIAALCRGELDLAQLTLTPAERQLTGRWSYHQALMNLTGGRYGPIQVGPFTRWAERMSDDTVRSQINVLLYGAASLSERFDGFVRHLKQAYQRLFDEGQLQTKTVPAVSTQLLAVILGLNDPSRYGLYQAGLYSKAAAAFGYPHLLRGSRGTSYAAATQFLRDVRDALSRSGCPTDNLVEAHNFLWVTAEESARTERWEEADFEAMRTDQAQAKDRVDVVVAKLRKVGDALRAGLKRETGRDLRRDSLGRYPPSRKSWAYVTEASSEARFGSEPTQRPQLNIEVQAEHIDVFLAFDTGSPSSAVSAVRAAVSERLARPGSERTAPEGFTELTDEHGRFMVRKAISREVVLSWPDLGADELWTELAALVPLYLELTAQDEATTDMGPETVETDPMIKQIDAALRQSGQVILYGPPGTGKTWTASRFAQWWLEQRLGHTPDEATALQQAGPRERRTWWIVANPQEWRWDRLFETKQEDYRYGRIRANYIDVRKGDLVIGYQATPDKRIVALGRIKSPLHDTPAGPKITLEPLRKVVNGLTYEELWEETALRESEPIRFRNQGTLFRLTATEADLVLARLAERDPSLAELDEEDPRTTVPQVTHVTFHPTYSYEDFVEGYRPVPSTNGQLNLELKPGSFKRVCDAARANSSGDYLVIIDEINRANLPKVFGELITVLERDKRGCEVTLQNGGQFSVPDNVFVIGTMNTADRSIRLLDAAFRRRFAFIECMPNLEPLRGQSVGPLALDKFLEKLNARIREKVGREKQIGQSYLLPNGKPIQTEEEFARHFRFEILPLLQEYAYDDYRQLRHFLGDGLVDEERQRMLLDGMSDHELAIRLAAGIARPVEPLPVEA